MCTSYFQSLYDPLRLYLNYSLNRFIYVLRWNYSNVSGGVIEVKPSIGRDFERSESTDDPDRNATTAKQILAVVVASSKLRIFTTVPVMKTHRQSLRRTSTCESPRVPTTTSNSIFRAVRLSVSGSVWTTSLITRLSRARGVANSLVM